ncbi:hypothetical protein ADIS_1019 [Lunatimonas lonarensis]|uniref:Glucuronosyltransferase n=1 Tax=Lunatimonas lonarensis TaxID=1232681 RepID=R7ZWX0_9BACT|nr:hypothetical protein [Lunatimonas lonarensis]EON78504.1 hypothetical protein ADIS_1019 [Lunatimonas lonarensis]
MVFDSFLKFLRCLDFWFNSAICTNLLVYSNRQLSVNMKKVLFLFPHFIGHLNRSFSFAEKHLRDSDQVLYLIFAKQVFPLSYPCVFLERGRFGSLLKKSVKERWDWAQTESEVLKSREMLRGLVKDLSPDIVYVDDFCAADLLLIWDMVDLSKVCILSPSFPAQRNGQIPPQQRFSQPGSHAGEEWDKWETEGFEAPITKMVCELVLYVSKKLGLPDSHSIWNFFETIPMYKNIRKQYCVCPDFDFPGQKLMPWESYAGWNVQLDREQQIDGAVAFLVKKAKSHPRNRLIYVSLGTVILDFIPKPKLVDFFEKVISIGNDNPYWYFFVQAPPAIAVAIRPKSINVFIRSFLPQVYLLRHANLSLSHGGTNSTAEAVLLGVPLLVFPTIDFLDTKGVCSRVVYHKLGRAAELDISRDDLYQTIKEMVDSHLDTDLSSSLT